MAVGIGDHHKLYLVTTEWPERATGPSKTPVSRWVSCFYIYSLVSIFMLLMFVLRVRPLLIVRVRPLSISVGPFAQWSKKFVFLFLLQLFLLQTPTSIPIIISMEQEALR